MQKLNKYTKMKKKEIIRTYTLSEVEDEIIGKKGTSRRDIYEYELKMDILGSMIKQTRKERNMTQEQLGELIGVQKSTISKLENHAKNITLDTIIRVFKALEAKIKFSIELDNNRNLEIV